VFFMTACLRSNDAGGGDLMPLLVEEGSCALASDGAGGGDIIVRQGGLVSLDFGVVMQVEEDPRIWRDFAVFFGSWQLAGT
jgi:hypothetical protein